MKLSVIGDGSKLLFMIIVLLERPVRRRGNYQVNGLVFQKSETSSITYSKQVVSGLVPECNFNFRQSSLVFG